MTGDHGTKDNEIAVPLKYLTNYCRTFEIPLIYCEINLTLPWLATSTIENPTSIAITDTKRYVLFVILSTKDNKRNYNN